MECFSKKSKPDWVVYGLAVSFIGMVITLIMMVWGDPDWRYHLGIVSFGSMYFFSKRARYYDMLELQKKQYENDR